MRYEESLHHDRGDAPLLVRSRICHRNPGDCREKSPANVSPLKVDYDNLSDLPIVTEPEGEDEKYSRNSIFFGLDYYGGLYKSADFGCISHVVWGDNGEVYIKNPFSGYDTQTYLVGEMEGIRFRSHSLRKYMRRLIQTGRTTRRHTYSH